MQRISGIFLSLVALTASSRFFVPQPPVETPKYHLSRPAVKPQAGFGPKSVAVQPREAERTQPWMYAVPMAIQSSEDRNTSFAPMLYGVGGVVVSLAVVGAMGGAGYMQNLLESRRRQIEADEANSLSQLEMISEKQHQQMLVNAGAGAILERRQMLIEQDEADSVAQLEFLAEKQLVEEAFSEDKKLAVNYNPAQSFFHQSNSVIYASAAMDSLLERRQMLLEQDEAESIQQLQYLSEKQKLETTRTMLSSLDAQIDAVGDYMGEVMKQTLTAGEEYARQLPGAIPLIGYFDPLGILTGSTEEKVQYYRDAELKHGRIGTLAAIGIIVSESFHPFGGDEMNGVPAVLAWQHGNMALEIAIVASAAALASRPQRVPDTERKQTTEIWHVRGGMLAAFGMIAQETVTGMPTCLACI